MRNCFIIAFLLLFILRSGISQKVQDYTFLSYENYLPTPEIGIVDFYKNLNEKWKCNWNMNHDKAYVRFEVSKDSTVKVVSSNIGHVDMIEEMNQKFSSISKFNIRSEESNGNI